jgi:hypothetical protein
MFSVVLACCLGAVGCGKKDASDAADADALTTDYKLMETLPSGAKAIWDKALEAEKKQDWVGAVVIRRTLVSRADVTQAQKENVGHSINAICIKVNKEAEKGDPKAVALADELRQATAPAR